jgi:NAD(P)-dependent dehydrogenase (short-subunit alcohol dehydrogenase family)
MARPVYVLTGATSGIGLHVTEYLARRTGALLIAGARNPDRATALKPAVPVDQLLAAPKQPRRSWKPLRVRIDPNKGIRNHRPEDATHSRQR